jgi:hypothetical protein
MAKKKRPLFVVDACFGRAGPFGPVDLDSMQQHNHQEGKKF